jgi:sugar-phosphatase
LVTRREPQSFTKDRLMPCFVSRAIVFDLDGTLVDSYADAALCWTEWARSVGVGAFEFAKVFGGRREEIVASLLPGLSNPEVATHVEQVRLAEQKQTSQVVARPGAAALLARLPPDRWAIVTSNDHLVAEARLRAAGLPMPRVLLSADEIERGKPDPQGLFRAASLLGVPVAEVVAIDDSPVGITSARAAGMPSIAVRFKHDDASLAAADAIVDNVGCLAVRLDRQNLTISVGVTCP